MAIETAKASGADRVLSLRLRVGALSGAVPDALLFAFDVTSRGTLVEDAVLNIESVSIAYWCDACLAEFEPADFENECPRCHKSSGELRRGRELEIASMEVN